MSERSPVINDLPDAIQVGNRVTVRRDGQPASVVRAEPDTHRGARMVTVNVGVSAVKMPEPAPGAGGRSMHLRGVLSWGAGAANFQADVDVHNGAQFSVAASTISLTVQFEKSTTPDDRRFTEATVEGGLVWGTAPGGTDPTRTLPELRLEQGASPAPFAVPPFAHSVRFFTPDVAFYDAELAEVRITLHGGPTLDDDPALVASPAMLRNMILAGGLRLPEPARFVTVENVALGVPLRLRPSFRLSL
jgi:hypothetical protein